MDPRHPSRTPPAGWRKWLPGIATLTRYRLEWLPHDAIAGLALSAVLVPVGAAYAVISGLPAINGLYATVIGLLAYAAFGPCRMLVVEPDSA